MKTNRKAHSRSTKRRLAIQRKPHSTRALATLPVVSVAEAIEKVLITGDLSPLSPEQRVEYYKAVCKSLGLNPLTNPFMYILFREFDSKAAAKLQLYATKSCSEQLRKIHGVSIVPGSEKRTLENGERCIVDLALIDRTGRTDTGQGVVALYKFKDGKRLELSPKEYDNAIMKTHTKAKRRGTLSICGLAFLDESELDHVQVVGGVTPDGRIYKFQETEEQRRESVNNQPQLQDTPAPALGAALFYSWDETAQKGYITGDRQLLSENKKLLLFKGKYVKEKDAVEVDAETLESLKYQFEQREVPFKLKREPGQEG